MMINMNDEYVTYILTNNMKITAKMNDVVFFNPMLNEDIMQDPNKTYINILQVLVRKKSVETELNHYKCHGE